ncbi:unnamed protein product [Chilo suppressalis]|uniref:Uncharacterized protein n=1 Tax=Chilo suppressalis TaxID=168631 RepID=A0ABN8L7I5_CHISP|nr:unnamed protein product [Chilo suppressalis]
MTKKSEIQQLVRRLSKTEKVLFGTFSSIVATVLVHPLDVIKVRLQVHEKSYNTRQMAWLMLKCEGASALYRGLTAGLMRQATATTTRLLVYNLLNDHLKRLHGLPNTTTLPTQEKVLIGLCAGLAGAFVGNPSEVALVRMMAEGKMEPCGPCIAKSPYRGVMHALYKIARDDGLCTLWRGGALTMGRSVVLSIAQIGVYAEIPSQARQYDTECNIQRHCSKKRDTLPMERHRSVFHKNGSTYSINVNHNGKNHRNIVL